MILFIELGIFNKRIVTPDGWRFAFREVVLMAGATAATRCTVASRRAVFVLRMRRGGKGSATFALASMMTTVVSARARRFFRILRIARRVAVATVSRTARDAVAFRIAVFVISGTGARRLALLALAFTGAAIVCTRAFFVVGCFVAIATAATGRTVARRRIVAVLRMFRRRFIFVNRASASVVTTIVSASASFFFRIVGFMAIATVFAVGVIARRRAVFVGGVFAVAAFLALASMFTAIFSAFALFFFGRFMTVATDETYCVAGSSVAGIGAVLVGAMHSVGALFALTLAGATVIGASAIRFFRVASAIVRRFAALGAAPLTALTFATTTSAAFTLRVGRHIVLPIVDTRAANPFGQVVDAAFVCVPSRVINIVGVCRFVKRRSEKFAITTSRRDVLFEESRAFVVSYAVCITKRRHISRQAKPDVRRF